jgi:hypothetical protein
MNTINDGPLISGAIERLKIELFDDLSIRGLNELAFRISTSMRLARLYARLIRDFGAIMLLTVLSPMTRWDIITDINSKRVS